ncbi:hypothetical protein EYF80_047344 [Liparis tanakae]|uniref:Uncharacterized protein n=1 Tax=Liparis tanakae TaxID=230148 RepID=A0A4Z2FMY2_9TELE|nr:hypothetical protein EYF80_047344 [Liparis tanakae]
MLTTTRWASKGGGGTRRSEGEENFRRGGRKRVGPVVRKKEEEWEKKKGGPVDDWRWFEQRLTESDDEPCELRQPRSRVAGEPGRGLFALTHNDGPLNPQANYSID